MGIERKRHASRTSTSFGGARYPQNCLACLCQPALQVSHTQLPQLCLPPFRVQAASGDPPPSKTVTPPFNSASLLPIPACSGPLPQRAGRHMAQLKRKMHASMTSRSRPSILTRTNAEPSAPENRNDDAPLFLFSNPVLSSQQSLQEKRDKIES